MKYILAYEWKFFLRKRIMVTAWCLMLAIGLYALYYGRSFNQTQLVTINKIDTAYQHRIHTQLKNFDADTATIEGKSNYNNARDPFMNEWGTRPMAWKNPSGLQAMSLGQSDNQPFYYNLWVYNNVYNNKQVELRNPDKLLSGNFDLAFVFIYLLPLLIIAFSYNVTSLDREQGIAGLLSVQGASERNMARARLFFRCGLILSLVLLLSIIGFAVNRVSLPAALAWTGISVLYTVFWFSLAYAFTSLRNAGSLTALKLVSIWIVLLILIPSLINGLQQPNDQAKIEIADAAREYPGTVWGMEKKYLADTLFAIKPAWKEMFEAGSKDTTELRSIAYAYFMGQKMTQVGRRIDSLALGQQRQLENFNVINPSYGVQSLYNKLAGTELSSYINFREDVDAYQQERYEHITAKRLPGEKLTPSAYKAYPVFTQPYQRISSREWLIGAGPLLFFILLFLIAGNYFFQHSKTKK